MPYAEVVLRKKGKPLKDGNYPIKLLIYKSRDERNYYDLNNFYPKSYDAEEWLKIKPSKKGSSETKGFKLTKEQRELQLKISAIEVDANKVIEELGDSFSFEKFKAKYFNEYDDKKLKDAFTIYINALKKDERLGTASSYSDAMNSFISYKGENLMLSDIDIEFLKNYEKWMLSKEKSISTVGIYCRSLRTILNIAIENGVLPKEKYPFGKRKYIIPTGKNIKKALKKDEISLLYKYTPVPGSPEQKAIDFWIFSYLGNGINFKDICQLKFKNMEGDTITFIRAKSERTKREARPVIITLTPITLKIIKRWGNPPEQNNYIFPILREGLTAEEERKLIKQFTKNTNTYLKRVGESLGITKKLRTYEARHSFSTMLKRSGAGVEFISEALGHESIQTTMNYLDSFEDEQRKNTLSNLTKFD